MRTIESSHNAQLPWENTEMWHSLLLLNETEDANVQKMRELNEGEGC